MVFRTADGGALVLGRLTFNFDGTPKSEGDKLSIGNDAAVLAGGKETTSRHGAELCRIRGRLRAAEPARRTR